MRTSITINRTTFAAMYAMILAPGTYTVKASNCTRIFDQKLEKFKYIVNLKAIAAHKVAEVREVFADLDSIEMNELNGLTMSANIIENEGQTVNIPMKNQAVKVIVDYVPNREGNLILAITNIQVPQPIAATPFSFEEAPVELVKATIEPVIEPKVETKAPVSPGNTKKTADVVTAADDKDGF
jgi:hypothetical protein